MVGQRAIQLLPRQRIDRLAEIDSRDLGAERWMERRDLHRLSPSRERRPHYPRAAPGTVAETRCGLTTRYTPPATTIPTSQLRSAPPSNPVEIGPCSAGTRPSSTDQPAIRPTTKAAIPPQLTSP